MNIDKLNKLIDAFSLNKSQFAARCGISRTTLDNLLNGADVKISTVESIASVLGVKVGFLFDDDTQGGQAIANGNNSVAAVNSKVNSESLYLERVKFLEQLLAEKERTIQILMGPGND